MHAGGEQAQGGDRVVDDHAGQGLVRSHAECADRSGGGRGQARSTDEAVRYRPADIARALAHPWSFAAGEVTRWPDVWGGRRDLIGRLDLALRRGQRVEGHTAGAAADKIGAIAAGGLTSDHEPITAREVLDRARQGIAVMLRESSLRPDLVGLLDGVPHTVPAARYSAQPEPVR